MMFKVKIPRWLMMLALPFSCFAICGGTFWFVDLRPQYLELDPPAMDGMLSWSNEQWIPHPRSTIGHDYLWRRETECMTTCGDWTAIIEHFDNWLTSEGWARVDNRYGSDCNPSYFPESAFLEVGVENGYITYATEDTGYAAYRGPHVCLAVWNTTSINHYNIVLLTINPSAWTYWWNGYDYM